MFHKKTKEQLKQLAVEIRQYKNKRKLENRENLNLYDIESEIHSRKYQYRHIHIAYCELRGRNRDQIEKPHDYNKPDNRYIERLKEKIRSEYEAEQALCNSQN